MRRTIRVSDGRLHVQRWNDVVHIVAQVQGPVVFNVTASGNVIGESFRVLLACGRGAKMYLTGNNRFTNQHPTCVACVGEDHEQQKRHGSQGFDR